MSLRPIKPKNLSLRRSLILFFSRQFNFKLSKLSSNYKTYRLQRFRLYRVNLKVERDFSFILKLLTSILDSDINSEYISISRVDFIFTLEQFTPKAPLELIFNENLFNLRVKSYSLALSILFT